MVLRAYLRLKMQRFLVFFSYFGKQYSGMQRQSGKSHSHVKTVAGVLEEALGTCFCPADGVKLNTSSRTDKGVHALCNAAHFDLRHSAEGLSVTGDDITSRTNYALMRKEEDIRIIKTLQVHNLFHCRQLARGRRYVYRLTCARNPPDGWCLPFSPLEFGRSHLVRKSMDMDVFLSAAEFLSGKHDYRAFTVISRVMPYQNPVKDIKIEVKPSHAFMEDYMPYHAEKFTNLEVVVTGNSFMFRQVRRLVATMLALACGDITMETVQVMRDHPDQYLANPEAFVSNPSIFHLTPYGLYLTDVFYKNSDLVMTEEEFLVCHEKYLAEKMAKKQELEQMSREGS